MKKLAIALLATTLMTGAAFADNMEKITEFRIGILGGENAQDRMNSYQCLLGGTLDMVWLGASGYAKIYLSDPEAIIQLVLVI